LARALVRKGIELNGFYPHSFFIIKKEQESINLRVRCHTGEPAEGDAGVMAGSFLGVKVRIFHFFHFLKTFAIKGYQPACLSIKK